MGGRHKPRGEARGQERERKTHLWGFRGILIFFRISELNIVLTIVNIPVNKLSKLSLNTVRIFLWRINTNGKKIQINLSATFPLF